MIKVDQVFTNHLEKLSKIELDAVEREKLRLEIIQALELFNQLDRNHFKSVEIRFLSLKPDQLRKDKIKQSLFNLFGNVPEQVKNYVAISTSK